MKTSLKFVLNRLDLKRPCFKYSANKVKVPRVFEALPFFLMIRRCEITLLRTRIQLSVDRSCSGTKH